MSETTELSKFSIFRVLTVSKRVIKQITRDRRTFGMLIVMPILIMLVFGIALSGEVKNIPIIIDNQDQSIDTGIISFNAGDQIFDSLEDDNRVNLKTDTWKEGVKLVEDGEYFASLLIPNNFSKNLAAKINGSDVQLNLKLHIDATKPSIRGSILGAIRDALESALGSQGVEITETIAFNGAEYTGLDTAIPAVMGFVLTFLILLISLLTLVRENIGGTLHRLYTTPLSKFERLLGYVIALTMIGLIEVMAILIISVFAFGAVVQGSILLLIASAFLYASVNVLLAVLLSNFAENELQAVQMAPLTALPSMALSGMLVPVKSLPAFAQFLSNFIPLTYGITIFEGIMLKGFGIKELWYEYLVLYLMGLILLVLASLTVKDHYDA